MKASDKTILLLAGTGDARRMANAITTAYSQITLISSLAGVTRSPAPIAGETRQGGFGGTSGLRDYLCHMQITAVIDATHPFAETMTANAIAACEETGIPYLRFDRPAWQEPKGAGWHHASSLEAAAGMAAGLGQRILLTIGSKDLLAFKNFQGPSIFARMTEPPPAENIPAGCQIILERGPFDLAHERALLSRLKVDLLVTKNSGGHAVSAKLKAADELGVSVLIIDRPPQPACQVVNETKDVLAWIEELSGE